MRRDPRRHNAENNSGGQREQEGEAEHDRRRAGVDGHLRGVGECQSKNHARAGIGDGDSDQASGSSQKHAFREQLADQNGSRRTQGGPNRSFCLPRCASGQQKIGNVGARDQQDQGGNPGQQAKAVSCLLLQVLDAPAAWR